MKDRFSAEKRGLISTKREEEGFTLLEVVIALTLTGFLLLMLSPTVFNLQRLLFRENEAAIVNRIQRLIYRKLGEILGNAYLYPFYDGKVESFSGEQWGFSLPVVTKQGLARAELFINGEKLIARWERYHSDEENDEQEMVVLTNQLVTSAFSYLDGKTGVWRNAWHEDYYPRLVQFNAAIEQQDSKTRALIPIVIPLKVGQKDGKNL
jgi:hypothetical protein